MKRILMLLFSCAFTCGCSDSVFDDTTKTTTPDNDTVNNSVQGGSGFDYTAMKSIVDGSLNSSLNKLKADLEGSAGNGEPVDYDKVRSVFAQTLDEKMHPPPKYQFLAAPNEKWIYRCNLQTGKIEVYTMTSNKLLLLSETRTPLD